jgi:hypothetical protein
MSELQKDVRRCSDGSIDFDDYRYQSAALRGRAMRTLFSVGIRQGIEFSAIGRRYHFLRRHPGDMTDPGLAGDIVRITIPQEFTDANLTFQVSTDGNLYNDLYDAAGMGWM